MKPRIIRGLTIAKPLEEPVVQASLALPLKWFPTNWNDYRGNYMGVGDTIDLTVTIQDVGIKYVYRLICECSGLVSLPVVLGHPPDYLVYPYSGSAVFRLQTILGEYDVPGQGISTYTWILRK